MYWIIICHLSGGLCQPRTSRGVEYPSSQWPGSVLSSRDSDKSWNLLVNQADSLHSWLPTLCSWLLCPCVSAAPSSPEEPTESHALHTHKSKARLCGARVLPTAWRPCTELSSGALIYDLRTMTPMNMRGDSWDSVLSLSLVGRTVEAEEPTERITGRDTKTVRVWVRSLKPVGERDSGGADTFQILILRKICCLQRFHQEGVCHRVSYSIRTKHWEYRKCPTAGDEVIDEPVNSGQWTPSNHQNRCCTWGTYLTCVTLALLPGSQGPMAPLPWGREAVTAQWGPLVGLNVNISERDSFVFAQHKLDNNEILVYFMKWCLPCHGESTTQITWLHTRSLRGVSVYAWSGRFGWKIFTCNCMNWIHSFIQQISVGVSSSMLDTECECKCQETMWSSLGVPISQLWMWQG